MELDEMSKHSMTALLQIRDGIQALIDHPENYGFALANYEHTVEALRFQCFETAGTDEYVALSLLLDQMRIMSSICRLVHDIEFIEGEVTFDD